MSGWSSIRTFDGWKAMLEDLLKQAKIASEANDSRARLRVCRQLLTFIEKSDPAVPGTDDLDGIALQAHQALSRDVVATEIAAIRARTAEILALTKAVERIATEAEHEAAGLRLTRAHSALDAITQAARALRSLDETLVDESDGEFKKSIAELVASLRRARDLIEKRA